MADTDLLKICNKKQKSPLLRNAARLVSIQNKEKGNLVVSLAKHMCGGTCFENQITGEEFISYFLYES